MEILNKIQKELKAPKGQFNSFSNFNYRSCEDILEAVKPLLGEAVLVIYDEIVLVGDRYYVKATAEISHNKEFTKVSAYAREALDKKGMDSAQITGATSSYARKYALNGLFLIDDTKDADSKDNRDTKVKKESGELPVVQQNTYKPKALNDKQKNLLRITIHQAGQPMPEDDWFETLDYETFNRALAKLKSMPKVVKTFPDLPKGDEDTNIEGDKKVDYDQTTGELL